MRTEHTHCFAGEQRHYELKDETAQHSYFWKN